ncbi:MAG: hypothetical protein WCF10_14255, partial [Polyangiales bacterium]
SGVCVEICSTSPDSCPTDEACSLFADLFADRTDIGLCGFVCDPLAQNCPDAAKACYLNPSGGAAQCANPFLGQGSGQQGDPCTYVNGCAKGYGCALNDDPVNATGVTCAFYCDSTGTSGPACSDGPGASFTCAELNTFYGDANAPAGVGICIDCTVWTAAAACQ